MVSSPNRHPDDRHPGESQDPGSKHDFKCRFTTWILAFARMTARFKLTVRPRMMVCLMTGLFFFVLLGTASPLQAASKDSETKISTQPIGSSYYRHLAFDMDWDLKKLVRYEKKGFGRAEIITLMLLSKITGAPLKDYGNRRLKKETTLKDMTEEAGLNYVTLYKIVRELKKGIESKGAKNLPPPIYNAKLDEDEKGKKKGKDEDELEEPEKIDEEIKSESEKIIDKIPEETIKENESSRP